MVAVGIFGEAFCKELTVVLPEEIVKPVGNVIAILPPLGIIEIVVREIVHVVVA
jgi:hypothetical protein